MLSSPLLLVPYDEIVCKPFASLTLLLLVETILLPSFLAIVDNNSYVSHSFPGSVIGRTTFRMILLSR